MKDRVAFYTPYEQKDDIPVLKVLLEAAVQQKVLIIEYEANGAASKRNIQPIGIYANQGKWYCPAYCFLRQDYRIFRCDRIKRAELDEHTAPLDLTGLNLKNRFSAVSRPRDIGIISGADKKGVERHGSLKWPHLELDVKKTGPAC